MSRGLGKMQRRILAALEPARQEVYTYRGCGHAAWCLGLKGERGWVHHDGSDFQLAEGVYDLRPVCLYLARKDGKPDVGQWVLRPSFSRAVRLLIACGVLEWLDRIPVQAYYQGPGQRDFVRKAKEFFPRGERRFVRVSATHKSVTLTEGMKEPKAAVEG